MIVICNDQRFWARLMGILLASQIVAAQAEEPSAAALAEVHAAIASMGGEHLLRSIRSIGLSAVGHRNMLEQSLRPGGPWWQDYFQLDELKDFAGDRMRIAQKHRGYSSPQWWLQHGTWDADPYYPVVVVADGAVAKLAEGKFTRYSSTYLQHAEEDLDLDPIQLMLSAESAPDLHALPDTLLHGFEHQVVAWTRNGVKLRLLLNNNTGLPERLQYTDTHPYDVFWNVWGDVETRVTFGMWALQPDGLRYPRQLDVERNGLPDTDVTITSLRANPVFDETELHIPDDVVAEYRQYKLAIDDLPLGFGGGAASEIEPGLTHIPGAWNVNLIRQNDGIVILEGPISSSYSKLVLAEVHRRFPALPVKAVVSTSDSWPHIGGLREYAALGIPIYAPALNGEVLGRLFKAPHTLRPDALQLHPRSPVLRLVGARTALGTGTNALELIPYRTETGERQMLVYLPERRLLYTSDLFAPDAKDTWFTPEYLFELKEAVAREHLDVDSVFGMHYDLTPYADVEKALQTYLAPR